MRSAQDVAAAIIVREDRVLATRRGPNQTMARFWEFPGGKLEPGETVQSCIVRELQEELSVDCEAGEVLIEHQHDYAGGSINLIAVSVRLLSDDWELSVHDKAQWVSISDLLELNLAPADIPIARYLQVALLDQVPRMES